MKTFHWFLKTLCCQLLVDISDNHKVEYFTQYG